MGRYDSEWSKDHQHSRSKHILVWEQLNGPLPKGWVVHHKDGNGHNNDISNLQAMSRGEHTALHASLRRAGKDVVDGTDPEVIRYRERGRRLMRNTYERHREEILARDKRYREEHRSEIAARQKEAYARNRDIIRERQRQYELAHKNERSRRNAEYYKNHVAERTAYIAKYNAENDARIKERRKKFYAANRDRLRANAAAFRAERRALLAAKQRLYTARIRQKSADVISALESVVQNEQIKLIQRKERAIE